MLLQIRKHEEGYMILYVRDDSESLLKTSSLTICYFATSYIKWVASVNTAIGSSFLADDEAKRLATKVLSTLWPTFTLPVNVSVTLTIAPQPEPHQEGLVLMPVSDADDGDAHVVH